jgi:AhpD family alkylhydroperoxidase
MEPSGSATKPFRKRFLSSPFQVLRHLGRSFIALLKLKLTSAENRISAAFSERINLAVSGVNECAYCTHLHTKMALEVGVTGAQAAAILAGEMEGVPQDEARAIAFAKYWTDSGGWDDTDEYSALVESYGKGKAKAILAAMHMVHTGNMCANTVEAYALKVEVKNKLLFFLAKTIAFPIAFAVKKLGGYPGPQKRST